MKKIQGFFSWVSVSTIKLLNLIVIGGAIASVVILFIVEHWPHVPVGWGLVGLGIASVLSGFFGIFYVSSRYSFCSFCHHLWFVISSIGLLTAATFIIFRLDDFMKQVHPKAMVRSSANAWMKISGAIYVVMLALQIIIFVCGVVINWCGANNYYDDNDVDLPSERDKKRKTTGLAEIKTSSQERAKSGEASRASQLSEKMREKYGNWAKGDDPFTAV